MDRVGSRLGCGRLGALAIFLGLASGCGGQDSSRTRLSLTLVEDTSAVKSALMGTTAASSTLNLGDIRGTRDFLFLLRNLGSHDATNIELTTDRQDFLVAPHNISLLAPDSRAPVVPLVRVTVVHGLSPDGPGLAPLMPMGPHTGTLAIAGTNFDPVQLALAVDAKVTDVDVLDGGVAIDLTQMQASVSSTLGGLGFIRIHEVSGAASIKNKGNVTTEVRLFDPIGDKPISKQSLDVGSELALPAGPWNNGLLFVGIAGQTVTDNSRLQLGNDGVAYFALSPPRP